MIVQPSPSTVRNRLHLIGRVVIGLLFLVAGAGKAIDPWSFHLTLPDYGISGPLRTAMTMVVPALEVVLGAGLILGWRVRLGGLLSSLLLAAFVTAIGIGWWRGTLEECGCFGEMLKRSPAEAIAIDLLFLAIAVGVWFGAARPRVGRSMPQWWKPILLATIGAASLVATTWLFVAGPTGLQATHEGEPHSEMVMVDLDSGEYLLYLFHPECPLCALMSPRVALYGLDSELPPVVGFTTLTTRADIDAYREKHNLRVPAQILSRKSLSRITGDGSVPQLVHVRAGRILRNWVTEMPHASELLQTLENVE